MRGGPARAASRVCWDRRASRRSGVEAVHPSPIGVRERSGPAGAASQQLTCLRYYGHGCKKCAYGQHVGCCDVGGRFGTTAHLHFRCRSTFYAARRATPHERIPGGELGGPAWAAMRVLWRRLMRNPINFGPHRMVALQGHTEGASAGHRRRCSAVATTNQNDPPKRAAIEEVGDPHGAAMRLSRQELVPSRTMLVAHQIVPDMSLTGSAAGPSGEYWRRRLPIPAATKVGSGNWVASYVKNRVVSVAPPEQIYCRLA